MPSFSKLTKRQSVDKLSDLYDLPGEIWLKILNPSDKKNVCNLVTNFCSTSKYFKQVCNDGFYDALNRELGWYWEANSLEGLRGYEGLERILRLRTAKEWFEFTCQVWALLYEHAGLDHLPEGPPGDYDNKFNRARMHPFLDKIILALGPIQCVDAFSRRLQLAKMDLETGQDWDKFIRVDRSDARVDHAIKILQTAKTHLENVILNVDNNTVMVEEFRDLLILCKPDIDESTFNNVQEENLLRAIQGILTHTKLHEIFSYDNSNHRQIDFGMTQAREDKYKPEFFQYACDLSSKFVLSDAAHLPRGEKMPELPEDTWIKALGSLQRQSVRETVDRLARCDYKFRDMFSEGFYDELNKKLGWYGPQESLSGVKPLLQADDPSANSAEDWFRHASFMYDELTDIYNDNSSHDFDSDSEISDPIIYNLECLVVKDQTAERAMPVTDMWIKAYSSLGRGLIAERVRFLDEDPEFELICSEDFYEGLNKKLCWYGYDGSLPVVKNRITTGGEKADSAKNWFYYTSSVYDNVAGGRVEERDERHPLITEITRQTKADISVELWVHDFEQQKDDSNRSNNWVGWVKVDHDTPAVVQAILTLDKAEKHLKTALLNLDNEELLIKEFSKLIELRQKCVDSFTGYDLPRAFKILQGPVRDFMNVTPLRNKFNFITTPDGKGRFSEIDTAMQF